MQTPAKALVPALTLASGSASAPALCSGLTVTRTSALNLLQITPAFARCVCSGRAGTKPWFWLLQALLAWEAMAFKIMVGTTHPGYCTDVQVRVPFRLCPDPPP